MHSFQLGIKLDTQNMLLQMIICIHKIIGSSEVLHMVLILLIMKIAMILDITMMITEIRI